MAARARVLAPEVEPETAPVSEIEPENVVSLAAARVRSAKNSPAAAVPVVLEPVVAVAMIDMVVVLALPVV